MVRLTIDGRVVNVPEGTTILEAARWLGVRIPTLCHVPGLEAAASCFVCAVQIEGRRTLAPACAMPVSEGMSVTTDSEDVRAARRMSLELLLSDHAGDCIAPCAATCPAGLEIPQFVSEIARDDSHRALAVISERLALPGSLGRICPRLCEQQCRRCDHDQGLAIGSLHRFAADHASYLPPREPATGKSAGIVGAGPAGLAAAWFLLRKGHACTLYDAQPKAGGMLRYGIPAHRLPKDALDAEIAAIEALGAEFRFNQRWGVDFTLTDLRRSHDAVFIAIGAQRSQNLRCEGDELALPAVEFLECVANANRPDIGPDVLVVGGGNTAMDCARAAVRLGARKVGLLYRRTRDEMPALLSEAEEAEKEGVVFDFLTAPVRLERGSQHRLLLTCQRMRLGEPDASGRRRPIPVTGSEYTVTCSTLIAAIGQTVDRSVAEHEGLQVSGWGIHADQRSLATNLQGVFAGGDAVLGADLAVRAVAMGRRAAASIDQYLSGQPVMGEPVQAHVNFQPVDDLERAALFREIERAARVRMPEIPMDRRRLGFDEVELGLPAADAQREARRCLTCGCQKSDCCSVRSLATEYGADAYRFRGARRRFTRDDSHPEIVYEPGKCILCDACVRIAAKAGEPLGLTAIGRGFDVAIAAPFGRPISEALLKAARECADACPTAALSIRGSRTCGLG
jgi:formate dehydrogenase major subunit